MLPTRWKKRECSRWEAAESIRRAFGVPRLPNVILIPFHHPCIHNSIQGTAATGFVDSYICAKCPPGSTRFGTGRDAGNNYCARDTVWCPPHVPVRCNSSAPLIAVTCVATGLSCPTTAVTIACPLPPPSPPPRPPLPPLPPSPPPLPPSPPPSPPPLPPPVTACKAPAGAVVSMLRLNRVWNGTWDAPCADHPSTASYPMWTDSSDS